MNLRTELHDEEQKVVIMTPNLFTRQYSQLDYGSAIDGDQHALHLPSTRSEAPVMNDDASLSMNSAAPRYS